MRKNVLNEPVRRSVAVMVGGLASMDGQQREAKSTARKAQKVVRPAAVSPELRELIHMLEAIEAEAPAGARPPADR